MVGSTAIGCEPPGPKAPIPKRPIDEGRADKIIAESLQKEGLEPAAPQKMSFGGKDVLLDVTVAGKKLGIAYLSPTDITELGDNPLARKKDVPGDPLRVETAGGGIHFVVLYSSDYVYDDVEGAQHEATVITAENRLDRDVRDFVNIARREHFD